MEQEIVPGNEESSTPEKKQTELESKETSEFEETIGESGSSPQDEEKNAGSPQDEEKNVDSSQDEEKNAKDLRQLVDEKNAEYKVLAKRRSEINSKIGEAAQNIREARKMRDNLNNTVQEIKSTDEKMQAQISINKERRKGYYESREKLEKKIGEKRARQMYSTADLDRRIREKKMEIETLSGGGVEKEREMIAEIDKLKRSRKHVVEIESLRKKARMLSDDNKRIYEEIKSFSEERREVVANAQGYHEEMMHYISQLKELKEEGEKINQKAIAKKKEADWVYEQYRESQDADTKQRMVERKEERTKRDKERKDRARKERRAREQMEHEALEKVQSGQRITMDELRMLIESGKI